MLNRRNFVKTAAAGSFALAAGKADAMSSKIKSGQLVSKPIAIDEIELVHGKVQCKVRFSFGKPDYFHFVFIRIKSGDFEGYGEGLFDSLKAPSELCEPLIGADARELENLLPFDYWHNPREAVAVALYDLVSKVAGLPYNVLLGGAERKEIPLMPCLFPMNPEDAAKKAKKFAAMGFNSFKFKMVGDKKEDLANLKAIRANVPQSSIVLSDANKGYKDLTSLIKLLPEFEKAGLNCFEDPLKGTISEYKKLMEKSNIKMIIDAGARSIESIREILQNHSADMINQHPCQQGGPAKAIMKSNASELMEVPTWVGGTGFLGVGSAANQHLASVIGLSFPCGELGGRYDHGFPDDIVKEPLPLKNGSVHLLDEPGLGVEIDEKSLAKLAIEKKIIS